MGLDISAYSNLNAVGYHLDCEDEDHIEAFAYDSFPASFRGIPVVDTYTTRHSGTLLMGGCYEVTAKTGTLGFRAGSYGGYNRWRAELQAHFNPERDPDEPFYELIWFADNEGCIGPDAAKDLLQDFRDYADVSGFADDHVYADFMRACELAADNGLIRFH